MSEMTTEDDSEKNMAEKPAVAEAPPNTEGAVAEPPREKMIETAVKFLLNPQVRSSLLTQKKAFLRKKGVTDAEIEIAIERSGTRQDIPKPANQVPQAPPPNGQVPVPPYPGAPSQQQMVPYMQPPPPSRVTTWRDYTAIAVIISGVTFGLYKLIMRFLSPWLKSRKAERERMERIEASIQELNTSVTQTVQALEKSVGAIQTLLEKQESQISALNAEILSGKALANSRRSTDATEIKAEITSLKGLLLSRNQFPSTPQRTQIPAWQRNNDQSSTKSNSPPPLAAEATTNRSATPSPPPTQDPIANGDDLSPDSAPNPVKEPTQEDGALKRKVASSPDECPNGGGVEEVESQAAPAVVNGTA